MFILVCNVEAVLTFFSKTFAVSKQLFTAARCRAVRPSVICSLTILGLFLNMISVALQLNVRFNVWFLKSGQKAD